MYIYVIRKVQHERKRKSFVKKKLMTNTLHSAMGWNIESGIYRDEVRIFYTCFYPFILLPSIFAICKKKKIKKNELYIHE